MRFAPEFKDRLHVIENVSIRLTSHRMMIAHHLTQPMKPRSVHRRMDYWPNIDPLSGSHAGGCLARSARPDARFYIVA